MGKAISKWRNIKKVARRDHAKIVSTGVNYSKIDILNVFHVS